MIADLPFCIIQSGKQKSFDLACAVIAGCGGGRMWLGDIDIELIPEKYTPVLIGVHPTTVATLNALHLAQRTYITIDNGYLRPYQEGGYFRATVNGLQLHWLDKAAPPANPDRFRALDIELKPYRRDGEHVLCALQTPSWYQMLGYGRAWGETLVEIVKERTNRPVIKRAKPLKQAPQPPLEEQLANAWAVVALSSNVMVKAAIAGVPLFSQSYCAISPLGAGSIFMLDNPDRDRPEVLRESVFHTLAAHQWTIPEMRAGRMWRDLRSHPIPSHQFLA